MKKSIVLLLFLLSSTTLLGCSSDDPHAGKHEYTLQFSALIGDKKLECGKEYKDIGKTKASIQLLAFRFFVHDIKLVRKNGEKVPLELKQDKKWQYKNIALLDFVNDTGKCKTGSPEVNEKVIGYAAKHDDYQGVSFQVGIPADLNNSVNAPIAPPPLNTSGMWWSWKGGFKYMRLDVKTDKHRTWFFHLGSSQCSGDLGKNYKCSKGNISNIVLSNFAPGTNQVVFDALKLYKDIDLNAPIDPKKDENKDGKPDDTLPGCMFERDPECKMLFNHLGLHWGAKGGASLVQSVFSVK